MNRTSWLIIGALVVVAGLGCWLLVSLFSQDRVIARAKSPDGSWEVTIVGQDILFGLGGVEVDVQARDSSGKLFPRSYVLGQEPDWTTARTNFAGLTCGNTSYSVGKIVFNKSTFSGQ